MEKKRSFTSSPGANVYLDNLKRGTLSDFLNELLEFMLEHDLDFLTLRDKILYAEKYMLLTDQLEGLLYSGQLTATQNIQVQRDMTSNSAESNVNKPIVQEVAEDNDTHDSLEDDASKYDLSVEEYTKLKEKAEMMGYDIETLIELKRAQEEE